MFTKVSTDGHSRWIVKKKFAFALLSLVAGFYIALKTGSALGEWTAFTTMVLGLVFAADVADKRLNGGSYNGSKPDVA